MTDRQREPDNLRHETGAAVPSLLTSTVGRSQELRDIAVLLSRPSVHLLVLTGPGGVGKSRLAIEVAHQQKASFDDGVYFVPLAPVRDANALYFAIASRLGLREAGERPLEHLLKVSIDQKRMLLVLDNFEQIVSAAPTLIDLLQHCPNLKLLVTSRTVLNVSGEYTYPVPPLDVGGVDENQLPDAVRLFESRAQAAFPTFALNNQTQAAVIEICQKLEGLPLAIELAAARLRHMTLPVLADHLTNQLNVLSQGPRDQPARLQTMRNAIAWSYELLDSEQQRLFRVLSVFTGGFTLDAAAAVSGVDGELDLLRRISDLLDCNLLWQRADDNGATRYRMLEVVREFGYEQLQRTHSEHEVHRAFADWAVELVEQGWPAMVRRSDQEQWLRRYDVEMSNFRNVMAWLESEQDSESFVDLAGGLFWYWYVRGHYSEGRGWLQRALDLPVWVNYDRFSRARAIYGNGILSHFQGDEARAIPFVEQALQLWELIGDEWGQGVSRLLLGIIAEDQGDYERARELVQRALLHAHRAGDRPNHALSNYHLGIIHWGLGDLTTATELCSKALDVQNEIGDRWGTANSLGYLGLFAALQGEPVHSNDLQQESLRRRLEIGTPYETEETANYLANIAVLAVRCGRPETAARLFGGEHRIRMAIGGFRGFPERVAYETASSEARALLGDAAFEEAWRIGRTQPIAESFAFARGFDPNDRMQPGDSPDSVEKRANFPDLTPREREILGLIAQGLTNAEIADRLFVTPGTVRIHVSNILRKLDAGNRTQAVLVGRSRGYLPAT
jgi:predicted ATPase/DNA-binding CsgD family transcriptional regulator